MLVTIEEVTEEFETRLNGELIKVGNKEYTPSDLLKAIDPTHYEELLNEFVLEYFTAYLDNHYRRLL